MKNAIPSRNELRKLLMPFEQKNNSHAIFLFLLDYILFFISQFLVICLPIELKIVGSILTTIFIGRLFIIGHDACHESFTNSRRLNYFIGQLAFLPSLTVFQNWVKYHNVFHHGRNNLATAQEVWSVLSQDVWCPLSPNQFRALTKIQQTFYRFYRSSLGVFFYYLEFWWKKFYRIKVKANKKNKKIIFEFVVVNLWLFTQLGCLFYFSNIFQQSFIPVFLFGFLLPFFLWNVIMGFLIYLHHTHPNIPWYENQNEWMTSSPYITSTVHLKFPDWISTGIHHIMEHTAHHLNTSIPCYNLKAAQKELEELLPEHIVNQDFSWSWYLECTRVCKLYDFEKHEWVGFPE